jgi:hypothetical protein
MASLHPGTNVFDIEGIDRQGTVLMGATERLSLVVKEK